MAKATKSLEHEDTWFIDSSCTQHMTNKTEFSSELKPAEGLVKI